MQILQRARCSISRSAFTRLGHRVSIRRLGTERIGESTQTRTHRIQTPDSTHRPAPTCTDTYTQTDTHTHISIHAHTGDRDTSGRQCGDPRRFHGRMIRWGGWHWKHFSSSAATHEVRPGESNTMIIDNATKAMLQRVYNKQDT